MVAAWSVKLTVFAERTGTGGDGRINSGRSMPRLRRPGSVSASGSRKACLPVAGVSSRSENGMRSSRAARPRIRGAGRDGMPLPTNSSAFFGPSPGCFRKPDGKMLRDISAARHNMLIRCKKLLSASNKINLRSCLFLNVVWIPAGQQRAFRSPGRRPRSSSEPDNPGQRDGQRARAGCSESSCL